jgi:hypothetical protein
VAGFQTGAVLPPADAPAGLPAIQCPIVLTWSP